MCEVSKHVVLEASPYLCWVDHVCRFLLSQQERPGPVCHLILLSWKRGEVVGRRKTGNGGGTEPTGREARGLERFWRLALL